ncbi:hypothetical protein Aoki45_08540 [Algoriphagus sp. oki45]|uniref:hypothetical protein n=1 Tax=Algoriphagus sp. oki45 TaxID=3067294 RepID=UPI0027EBEE6A|nr:hypothetical protein Aoki45_08540 [Algoriphagus sp. oki45]
MKNHRIVQISLLVLLILFSFVEKGFAQFTSTFQNAESVGKGKVEAVAWYTSTSAGFEGERDGVLNIFGLMAGLGLSDKTEIRVRYDRLGLKEGEGEGFNNLTFGPKFSNETGRFAFYLPFGIVFDEFDTNWMAEPSFILTFPIGENFLINATPSYMYPFGSEANFDDGLVKLNLGMEVKIDGDWRFRPEATLMYFAESIGDGHFLNLGIAAAKRF